MGHFHQHQLHRLFSTILFSLPLFLHHLFVITSVAEQYEPLPLPCAHRSGGHGGPGSHYPPHVHFHAHPQRPIHRPHVHQLSRSAHRGREDPWHPLPPPMPGPFWTDPLEHHHQFEGNQDYVPVLRVVQSYSTGPEGPEGGQITVEEETPPGKVLQGETPTVQQSASPIGTPGIESSKMRSPMNEVPLISAAKETDSLEDISSDKDLTREYGPGVTYTRFRLPDPSELVTGESPLSIPAPPPPLPNLIYRLESPLPPFPRHHTSIPLPPSAVSSTVVPPALAATSVGTSINKKRKKGSSKSGRRKKKPKPSPFGNPDFHATTSLPSMSAVGGEMGDKNTDPIGPYSVNKIIVIEEDPTAGPAPPLQPGPQLERPNTVIDTGSRDQFVNIKDFHAKRVHFPGAVSSSSGGTVPNLPPIKTIKDLHDRLNQTLLLQPQVTYASSTIPPILAELISKISSLPTTTTMSTISVPSFVNDSSMHSKHFTGASGYFVKANRFQFENSWNDMNRGDQKKHLSSLSTSTEGPRVLESSNQQAAATSTPPTVIYFTSQRTFIPTPPTKTPSSSTTVASSSSSTVSPMAPSQSPLPPPPTQVIGAVVKQLGTKQMGPESYAARKHGHGHLGLDSSSSARHEFHDKHQQHTQVDMAKVGSIVIGFCVAMMALAGVILMVLHRDTVSGQLRHLSEIIETRYPNFRLRRSPSEPSHHARRPGAGGFDTGQPTRGRGGGQMSPELGSQFDPTSPLAQARHHTTVTKTLMVDGVDGIDSGSCHAPLNRRVVSVPIPPPPPPPPPTQGPSQGQHCSTVDPGPSELQASQHHIQQHHHHQNQDLIEQIIGRPAQSADNGSFSNKKCRQYFSRVHRWVPKRPPLPDDLKSTVTAKRVHL